VQTAKQATALQTEQCDELQGYFASVPLPADQFAELLRQWQPNRIVPSSTRALLTG
jgi:EAL domain-containing protein (putative c-di-GMP-specific phosphodiesterase class I)